MFNNPQQRSGCNPLLGSMQQPQQMQQPQMMQGPQGWPGYFGGGYQQDQRGSTNGMWIPVNSLDEARNAFVQPGQEKWFMVTNQMVFAVKSLNSAGVVDFQAFDFAPHVEQEQTVVPGRGDASVALLGELAEKMKAMLDKVSGLEETVDALKEERENGKSAKQVSNSTAKSGSSSR